MKAGTTISKLKDCSCKVYQTNTLKSQTNSVGQIATPEDLIIDSLVASITLKDNVS